jgi:hypothetical protein
MVDIKRHMVTADGRSRFYAMTIFLIVYYVVRYIVAQQSERRCHNVLSEAIEWGQDVSLSKSGFWLPRFGVL